MKKTILTAMLFAFSANAQTPTIVYGASETAPGKPDEYLLVQPEDAPNPLGDPIPEEIPANAETTSGQHPVNSGAISGSAVPSDNTPMKIIKQNAAQNPAPFSETPQQEQNQIENTLYEGGDRIYDVQSYPVDDIKTITEPNVDPTITTYPEY